ncbi:hypothetical protein PV762_25095 [Mitsuaria sp. CC2]|uniref:DUF3226 domain-containing protein n=1 Tax=Mitsuaria sp. CC2 TaxID=3029186 RepID=UPI003B8CD26A
MKAVFVFCEGNHDVTFITRSLGQVANATWVGGPIGALPSPLGPVRDPLNPLKPKLEGLIAKRYSGRAVNELQLRAAAHAPLPAFDAIVRSGDTLYVLIRCQGDGASQAAMDLIDDVGALLNPAFGTDIQSIAAAFFFDADAAVAQREAAFSQEFLPLLKGKTPLQHGGWVKGNPHVGLFVFHDANSRSGTLEQLIAPMLEKEWNARWHAADALLKQHAQSADPVSTKQSERLKAQISITGQFLFPGDPMSVVISKPQGSRQGLPDLHFNGAISQSLVNFLQGVPW